MEKSVRLLATVIGFAFTVIFTLGSLRNRDWSLLVFGNAFALYFAWQAAPIGMIKLGDDTARAFADTLEFLAGQQAHWALSGVFFAVSQAKGGWLITRTVSSADGGPAGIRQTRYTCMRGCHYISSTKRGFDLLSAAQVRRLLRRPHWLSDDEARTLLAELQRATPVVLPSSTGSEGSTSPR